MSRASKVARSGVGHKEHRAGGHDINNDYARSPNTPTDEEGGVEIEFKHELLDHFLGEAQNMGQAHDEHTADAVTRIQEFEKLQDDHAGTHRDNHANQDERRKLTSKIEEQSKRFEQYAKDSAQDKRNLRGELDELEDTLRKLKDQISEAMIENKNLELVIETENSIQDAKQRAEADAINAVNRDLKELVGRLAADAETDISYKDVAEKLKGEVEADLRKSKHDYDAYLNNAQVAKAQLEEDLKELKDRTHQRNIDNDELRGKIEQGEIECDRLRDEIAQLNGEIEQIKRSSEETIRGLESDRVANEKTILDLRTQAEDLKHQHSELELSLMKINSQLRYLEEVAKTSGDDLVRKKVQEFDRVIKDTDAKTEQLKAELNGMNRTWLDTVDQANREMSTYIHETESKASSDKINALIAELEEKQAEINELKRKRNQLERELAATDPDGTQREISSLHETLTVVNEDMIGLLRDKNRLYGELIQYTRELFELNAILQKNEQDIAKLRLELESLRKEQQEKGIIYEELRAQIDEKRRILEELNIEINRNEQVADALEQTLNERRAEGEELDQLLADRDAIIRKLEAQLEEINRNMPPPVPPPAPEPEVVEEPEPVQENYVADMNDEVDKLLAQYINFNTCPVPVKRLGGGYYLFGTRKIYAKIMNGRLVIRVGGGYMIIDEFIATYAEVELNKMRAREEKGLPAIPDHGERSPGSAKGKASPKGSPKGSPHSRTTVRKSSGSRSPQAQVHYNTGSNRINGTFRSKKLNQDKFDRLRSQNQ